MWVEAINQDNKSPREIFSFFTLSIVDIQRWAKYYEEVLQVEDNVKLELGIDDEMESLMNN